MKTKVLKIFLPGSSDSSTKDGRFDLLVQEIKRVHESLDPCVIDVDEELPNGFFGGGGSRVSDS